MTFKFPQWLLNSNILYLLAVILAVIANIVNAPIILAIATIISEIFISLLKLVSIPIIFLSIVSTISGMESVDEFKTLGKKVIKYTLLTTVIAASVALAMFVVIDPVQNQTQALSLEVPPANQGSYLSYLIQSIPSNIVQPFLDSHVIGVLFVAILLSLSILSLPEKNKTVLHSFFSSLFASVMKITGWIVSLLPFAIWSFILLFLKELEGGGLHVKSLALYLCCVVGANLIQGFVVLPLFLKIKGIAPLHVARSMWPALSLAFFSKSSSATLPLAMRCAEENLQVSSKVAGFSLPLCTTINMNACAGFILITVLYVSMSNGVVFSPIEMILWIGIATLAAVGNAGVPMGCYFLASAFLAAMNVPLHILGVILPFYAIIDMFETAINVWSDSCVAVVVDRETQYEAGVAVYQRATI